MNFTPDELILITKLSQDFESFLRALNIPTTNTARKLLSAEKIIEVPSIDRLIVEAWVAWQMEFKTEKTIMWLSAKLRDAHERREVIETMTTPLGSARSACSERGNVSIYQGYNRAFYRRASTVSGKGLSMTALIVEGVEVGSKLFEELRMTYMPTLCGQDSKWVTILE